MWRASRPRPTSRRSPRSPSSRSPNRWCGASPHTRRFAASMTRSFRTSPSRMAARPRPSSPPWSSRPRCARRGRSRATARAWSCSRTRRAGGGRCTHSGCADVSLRIGLISDTHGLLRPAALDFLRGCDHIVHGGDIGNAAVLDELAALAPFTAVRGNNDHGAWADALPEAARVQLGEVVLYVLHDLAQLAIDPAAAGVDGVMSGPSHKPLAAE